MGNFVFIVFFFGLSVVMSAFAGYLAGEAVGGNNLPHPALALALFSVAVSAYAALKNIRSVLA